MFKNAISFYPPLSQRLYLLQNPLNSVQLDRILWKYIIRDYLLNLDVLPVKLWSGFMKYSTIWLKTEEKENTRRNFSTLVQYYDYNLGHIDN